MPATATIHPTAIIGPEVTLGEGVVIGPYCVLDGQITLGDRVHLLSNVTMLGPVNVGAGTKVFPNVCLGFRGQDVKWKDDQVTAGVVVGQDCQLREGVTLHAATRPDIPTTLGDRCFLMVGSHLGHDARIGNDVILVNMVQLAGHTQVGDRVTMGGGALLHQFCRIGRLAFIGGGTTVIADVPPFCMCAQRGRLQGLNVVGLRRNGVPREEISALRSVFRRVFRVSMPRKEMVAMLEDLGRQSTYVMEWADFVRGTKRTVASGVSERGVSDAEDSGNI